jgi:hypothetical protein
MSAEPKLFVVRVFLEGANKQEHGEAVEAIGKELEQRGYRNPMVDWQSEAEGPVFHLEVEADDSGSVALFVEDDIVEAGSAFLADFDKFTVTLLDIEPAGEEEENWPAEYTFAVSHWPAHLIAIVSAIIFGFFAILGFVIKSPLVAVLFSAAFLSCVWLLLAYGKTTLTERGVTHTALLGKYAMEWSEPTEVVVDSGGNTVVLKSGSKQLVLPGFSLWAGREKRDARDIFLDELEWRNIPLKRGFAAFAVSRRTRVH